MTETAEVHFGDRTVRPEEKQALVRGVFDAVANRYDLMNDFMSLGLHRAWKKELVDTLAPKPGEQILDLAGGTGDISFKIHARLSSESEIVLPIAVCDINHAMLREGRDRAINRNLLQGLTWITGNAESLPFKDRSVDGCTMAFGIRNVTHIDQALKEIHRVLKPGGRFCCLEFSPAPRAVFQKVYDAWSFSIIPQLGRMFTGDSAPYDYLVESIRRFPAPDAFAKMIETAGFGRVNWRPLAQGVVAIHKGWRI